MYIYVYIYIAEGCHKARRHHGAFFLAYLLLLYVQSWQDLYAATTVQMQVIPKLPSSLRGTNPSTFAMKRARGTQMGASE